tara:strand:+ start:3309 stop:3548 length:240 start_codon:yes stop_codon:yes gene_type:complete
MHIPKKHMVEEVEKAMKEAEEHEHKQPQMPGVKIVVNIGAPSKPMHMAKPMKKKMMKKVKGKKKARMAGKMEDALSGMY